jgi:hypothetical protein
MALLDIIAAVAATATAAVVVGVIGVVYPGTLVERVRIVVAFAVWFVLIVVLAALNVFDPFRGFGVPALGFAVVVPMVVMALAARSSAERLARVMAMSMTALIAIHVLRILGLEFLLLWSGGRLTAPFAPSAGWGDIITGAAAVPLAWAVWREAPGWRSFAIAWNLFGAADLIAAIAFGTTSAPGTPLQLFTGQSEPVMTMLPWILIPAYLVPIWLMTHVLMLVRLTARSAVAAGGAHRLLA